MQCNSKIYLKAKYISIISEGLVIFLDIRE